MDAIIDGFIQCVTLSTELSSLYEQINKAFSTDKGRCGNCTHWMCFGDCPSEERIHGRPKGPSMSGITCSKFEVKPWVMKMKSERLWEIKKHKHYRFIKPRIRFMINKELFITKD